MNSCDQKVEYDAALVLENGLAFLGFSFGAPKTVSGEIVFNTGMVGYVESITDPSYAGQILCQTYPLVGNYGINSDWFESSQPKIEGYVIHELCRKPSHWSSQSSLAAWLESSGIPGIFGIDTRKLTKTLRTQGVMLGILSVGKEITSEEIEKLKSEAKKISDPNKTDLVARVTAKNVVFHHQNGKKKIVVIDCGVKNSIIKSLVKRDFEVVQVPANFSPEKILEFNPSGIVISNGPGDPKKIDYVIKHVQRLIECRIPVFGICLGNQIIGLAMGLDTYKLKFGHRGQNHPCIDLKTKKCFITSQNHGYAVQTDAHVQTESDRRSASIGWCAQSDLKVSFVNANDKSVEGVEHEKLPIFGVQFHPEASPGPYDTDYLFDKFAKLVENYR